MPEQELSTPTPSKRVQATRLAYVVSTTTHGKLMTDSVEREPGWVTLQAPIIAVDTVGTENPMDEVQELSIPSVAVRQIVREK